MSFWDHNPTLAQQLAAVDQRLHDITRCREKIIQDAAVDLIEAPGKRLRPALALLSASYGTATESVIDVAAAVELLHMATLVHDDIIDEVKLRRGVQTTQARFGKDVAVYTGDFLFVKCFQLLSEVQAADRLPELARAMQIICEGEVNQYSSRYLTRPSVLGYMRRIRGKTAVLFALAAAIGAKQAQCTEKQIKLLSRYGLYLGMAFQIQDDILDLVSTDENIGKPVGNDIKEGIYTLPVIFALMHSEWGPKVKDLLSVAADRKVIQDIAGMVKQADGIKRSRQVLAKYLKKAEQALAQLPANQSKQTLQLLLEVPFHPTNPLQAFRKAAS